MVIDQFHRPSRIIIHDRNGQQTDISIKMINRLCIMKSITSFNASSKKGQSPINTFALSVQTMSVMDEARRQMGIIYPADRQM